MNFLKLILVLFILSGCGSSNSGAASKLPVNQKLTISGLVFTGTHCSNTVNAGQCYGTIDAYDFSSGSKGSLIGTASIGYDATFQIQASKLPASIKLEANFCTFDDAIVWKESNNDMPYSFSSTPAPSANYCASIPIAALINVPNGASSVSVVITPYTHAASGLASYEISGGTAVSTAINDANGRISGWIGADILQTIPLEPDGNAVYNQQYLYGAAISSIPSWIYNMAMNGSGTLGTGNINSIAFADAMRMDLQNDGLLDGVGIDSNKNVVNLTLGGITLDTSVYRHQLPLYSVFRVRAETEGYHNNMGSGSLPPNNIFATEDQKQRIIAFLPSFVAMNDSTDPMFQNLAVVPLNNAQPTISLTNISGVSYTGDMQIRGYMHSNVGIYGNYTGKNAQGYIDGHTSNVMIYVDGAYYRAISPANYYTDAIYTTYAWVNTTQFANGAHTVTIYVTDNLGGTTSISIPATFAN